MSGFGFVGACRKIIERSSIVLVLVLEWWGEAPDCLTGSARCFRDSYRSHVTPRRCRLVRRSLVRPEISRRLLGVVGAAWSDVLRWHHFRPETRGSDFANWITGKGREPNVLRRTSRQMQGDAHEVAHTTMYRCGPSEANPEPRPTIRARARL